MTTASSRNSSAPIDVVRFHELFGDIADDYSETLGEYISQMTENLQRLEAAVSTRDHRAVEMIAHRCFGTSATCGMTAVVAPLRELESAGRAACLNNALPLVARIRGGFESICAFLKDYSRQRI